MVVGIDDGFGVAVGHSVNHGGEAAGVEARAGHQPKAGFVGVLFRGRGDIFRRVVVRQDICQIAGQSPAGKRRYAGLDGDLLRHVVRDVLMKAVDHFVGEDACQLVPVAVQGGDETAVDAHIVGCGTGRVEGVVGVDAPAEGQRVRRQSVFAALDQLVHHAVHEGAGFLRLVLSPFRHVLIEQLFLDDGAVAHAQELAQVIVVRDACADDAGDGVDEDAGLGRLRRGNEQRGRNACGQRAHAKFFQDPDCFHGKVLPSVISF